jgi:acyltransferase
LSTPAATPESRTPPATGGGGARRVIFIDLARALAVVFMLYGHTVDALLSPEYRSGLIFEIWTFQRGLTSCLFLLLSGFAFSIATARRWSAQVRFSPALVKRLRRFGLFVLLGYALHFPAARFADLPAATEQQWRSFFAVDVLQLIGVTFVGVQILVMLTRSRRVFMITTLVLAAALAAATPWFWGVDWEGRLPLWLAAYLTPSAGSQFPVLPWAAFVLIGAGLGQIYSRWGAADLVRYANLVLLAPGAVMIAVYLAVSSLPFSLFGDGPNSFIPTQVLVRTGASLVILGAVAHASRRITRLPHVFAAVAQETLLIYFIHLCIVYGSVWNRGLAQIFGMSLTPRSAAITVVMLVAAMAGLASYWNWMKHARPRGARWVSIGAVGALLARLL